MSPDTPSSLHTRNRSYAIFHHILCFFLFFSKRVKSLIFIQKRSTMLRGVHRHQAIVVLALHVSSENLGCLYESTMNDAIFNSVPHLLYSTGACAYTVEIHAAQWNSGSRARACRMHIKVRVSSPVPLRVRV